MINPVKRLTLIVILCWVSFCAAAAQKLNVAVAANFKPILTEIADRYTLKSNIDIHLINGSTGALFAQITHGAPIDIFFAADVKRPLELEKSGKTRARMTYAYGRLVLFGPQIHGVSAETMQEDQRIAIANPRHAPYGRAAIETLKHFGVSKPSVIYGSNVAQAFAFVTTGNTPLGLIALSQLRWSVKPEPSADHLWIIPEDAYQPIEQQLVITKDASLLAEAFVSYLKTDAISLLLINAGYRLPEAP